MYILNYKKDTIHDTAFIQRFVIAAKPGGVWLVCAALGCNDPLITLGRYFSEESANDVFSQLFTALHCGDSYFEMPTITDENEERRARDARVKRRGGS